jgi:hypothetical protein
MQRTLKRELKVLETDKREGIRVYNADFESYLTGEM